MPGEIKVIMILLMIVVVKKITPSILVLPCIKTEDLLENIQDYKI